MDWSLPGQLDIAVHIHIHIHMHIHIHIHTIFSLSIEGTSVTADAAIPLYRYTATSRPSAMPRLIPGGIVML